MTDKHRLAIRLGLKRAQQRRRRSAAMIASWANRKATSAQSVRPNNEPQQLIEALTQLAKAKQRCRELLSKLDI
jgi:uridine kinase